jgi:hypothetical protein
MFNLLVFSFELLMLRALGSYGGEFFLLYSHQVLLTFFNHQLVPLEEEQNDDYTKRMVIIDDMIMTPKQYEFLYTNSSSKRSGFTDPLKHWPGGVIPYKFENDINEKTKQMVKDAMKIISSLSCIKFEETNKTQVDHVLISNSDGCTAAMGNVRKGPQAMGLHVECELGGALHLLFHGLGFIHMHTTPDRDEYVKVDLSNVIERSRSVFNKITKGISMYGTEYDYSSIMHYPSTAFAIHSSKPTITPLKPAPRMGQRDGE